MTYRTRSLAPLLRSLVAKRCALRALRLAMLLILSLPSLAEAGKLEPRKRAGEGDDRAALRVERRLEVESLTEPLRRELEARSFTASGDDRAAAVDTATVGVFLLAFRENRRPDCTTVPADGKFMAASDTIPSYLQLVDPPPHDRAYFEAHMLALREFYDIQSYGKLFIQFDVLTHPDGGPFLLPDLADYAPCDLPDEDFWTIDLLESFMRTALDSIDFALQAVPDGPRFSDYEHVMIFHAGSDLQNDIYQDSPNDLPSFNIFFGDSVLVDGGATLLSSVLLLPETSTQDAGPNDALGALNAVTAHEFGHQLGLVDTYNTLWGWPSVGYWDLMDSGHQQLWGFQREGGEPVFAYGALPASLSMWHRMLLGWVNEADGSLVRPGGGTSELSLGAANRQEPGVKAVRVDLSDREYFLFESRQEILWDAAQVEERSIIDDDATGVILFMSVDDEGVENSGEYDLFLPQSGLLAWHADERDFEFLYPYNEINLDDDRHLRLIEADGADDLGNPYSFNWRGNELDPFFTGNRTEWTTEGIPSTRLRDGTPSGFEMSDLVTSPYLPETEFESYFDSTITFTVKLSGVPEGYPREDGPLFPDALAYLPLGGSLLPMGDWLTYFMAVLNPDSSVTSHWVRSGKRAGDAHGLSPLPPLPAVAGFLVGGAVFPVPVLGGEAWFFATGSGVYLWRAPDGTDGATELYSEFVSPAPASIPVVGSNGAGDRIWAAWNDAEGKLSQRVWDIAPALVASGGVTPRSSARGDTLNAAAPVVANFAAGPRILHAFAGSIAILDPLAEAPGDTMLGPDPGDEPFWLLPIDADGDGFESLEEIFWIDATGRIFLLGSDSFRLVADLGLGSRGLTAAPIVADIDADGTPELFLAAGSRVHRLSLAGYPYSDWPLRLEELANLDEPMRVGGALRAADMDGDDRSELIVFSDTGHLIIVDDGARPVLGTPRSLGAAAPVDAYAPGGMVIALSRDGYLLGFSGVAGGGMEPEWSLAGGGPTRAGRWLRQHAQGAGPAFPGSGWVLYPNPAGAQTKLHNGAVPAGTTVAVEIFDLEGQSRLRSEERVLQDGPYELTMDLRDLASAVYFARVEVRGDGGSSSFIRRLGVLR